MAVAPISANGGIWMSSGTPLVSIVVPTYECARFLPATLDSIRNQTLTSWECIVVDDGSSDGSDQVSSEYAARDYRIRSVRQANAGPSAARNHGFRLTDRGSLYVTFMDGDDLWMPTALERLAAENGRFPDAVGSSALAEFIDEHGQRMRPGEFADFGRRRLAPRGGRLVPLPRNEPSTFASLVAGNVTFPPGLVLARREIYEEVGAFDESLRGAEDWDMLLRLSRHGDIRFVDEVVLHYRRHSANLGASSFVPRYAFLVGCKNFHSPENTPAQRTTARKAYRAKQFTTAFERLGYVQKSIRAGRPAEAIGALARVSANVLRYLRGSPPRPSLGK
ncbi:MAG TPA: glycosyltransferase [Tepidisphaeraceae bacterium]|nr:glycosyltransferase [Tepidisphaeraceae bacterium]